MRGLAPILCVALAAGIALGVASGTGSAGLARLVLATGWGVSALAWGRRRGGLQIAGALLAAAAAGWLLGGAAVGAALDPPLRNVLNRAFGGLAIGAPAGPRLQDPVTVEGRLLADAAVYDDGVGLRIAVTRVWIGRAPVAAPGGLSVTVGGTLAVGAAPAWRAGRLVRAPVLVRRPARYLNDGVPDQERALARKGIALVGTIKSAALVDVVGEAPWWDWAAASVRARTRDVLQRRVGAADPQAGAVATAILIGDRAAIAPDVQRRLQEAGTYHVVAISGGNIAILAALVLALLSLAGAGPGPAAASAILVLTAYAVIAGGGPSVARATVMAVIYLAARLVDQRAAAASTVSLTAVVLLVADPLTIVDVGAWLTFGATAAILLGAGRLPPLAGWWRHGGTLLAASVSAETLLLPIAARVFERVTVAGLLLNFIAIPSMTVVQVAAMATVAGDVAGLGPLAAAAGWGTRTAAHVLLESGRLVDAAPWLAWRVPAPMAVVVAAYYAAVGTWWWSSRRPVDTRARRRLARGAAGAAVALGLWIAVNPPARARSLGDGRLHLRALDVGQGESLLVTFPDGRLLLVDAGGLSADAAFDIGDRVVGPALRALGIVRLDYLAITHGDPDHLGGARSIVRDFEPLEIWEGVPVPRHEPTAALHELARARRVTLRAVQRGDRMEIGGVEVRVLHPPLPDWERQRPRNDDSLVLALRLGGVSMLLTGDAGRETEASLVPELDLPSLAVLKVGHHGSGTSSSAPLLDAVRPDIALISAGRANPYGHPVPAVLARLRRAGAEIFRTDKDGAVEVTTDGTSIDVRTYVGGVRHAR